MGYIISKTSVDSLRNELDTLAKNISKEVFFDSWNPKRLAYVLREAMYSAEKLNIEPYNKLRTEYTITVESSRVVCKRESTRTLASHPYIEFNTPDFLDVLDIYVKNKSNNVELRIHTSHSLELDEWLKSIAHEWDNNTLVIKPSI